MRYASSSRKQRPSVWSVSALAKKRPLVIHRRLRDFIQLITALISNAYITGFLDGKIYQGGSKALCVPGLNCYACPGALGSCPIGSLQAVIGSRGRNTSLYVGGFLAGVGATLGRFVCGWLCPFGWFQDLLYKIPFPKKLRRLPGEKFLALFRYLVLLVLVIILPIFAVDFIGQGTPWYCKWVCPSGTLSGLLLLAGNAPLRSVTGWLFAWKNLILLVTVGVSLFLYRPFCRYVCPLGAIYGVANHFSLYRLEIDTEACVECGACQRACKLDIPTYKTPNSSACIRCGDCIKACPYSAIKSGFRTKVKPASKVASGCQG